MRRVSLSLLLLAMLCAGCGRPSEQPIKAVAAPPDPFPVPVIDLRGGADEIGAEHARNLAQPIRNLFAAYFGEYFQSDWQRNVALMAASAFESHISPEHRAEIHALAAQVGIDQRQVMLGQCFLDLSAMTACSTFTLPAAASPDGVARFGRNLDFPSFNVADKSTVVLIVHPKDRYAFASIAWPGMIGVLSGMNEHGLALANMEVDRGQRLPVAMPYTLLYRSVLENCRTVADAVAFLEKTPRQTANNLMLMDGAGDRAVVEITPEKIEVRRAAEGAALISTNHHRGVDLDTAGRCRRFDYLHDESAKSFGQIDREQIETMLSGAAQGKMTLQSMIFEPSTRTIYLAVGAGAPTRGFHRLDLSQRFR
jgi:predicted choloylglycine hydrolase